MKFVNHYLVYSSPGSRTNEWFTKNFPCANTPGSLNNPGIINTRRCLASLDWYLAPTNFLHTNSDADAKYNGKSTFPSVFMNEYSPWTLGSHFRSFEDHAIPFTRTIIRKMDCGLFYLPTNLRFLSQKKS